MEYHKLFQFCFTFTILTLCCGKSILNLDPVDQCLYTCSYCFRGNIAVKCANTCVEVDGMNMPSNWYKNCPQFGYPLFID